MELVEHFAVQDCFATGLARVDILEGGFARFVLYVERQGPSGIVENVIVQQLVMPLAAVPEAIHMTNEATAKGRVAAIKRLLHGVH